MYKVFAAPNARCDHPSLASGWNYNHSAYAKLEISPDDPNSGAIYRLAVQRHQKAGQAYVPLAVALVG